MFSLTRFEQVLRLVPRAGFDAAVQEHGANRWCKSFDSARHLKAMLYGQFSGCTSLRELQNGFEQHHRVHYHLGLPRIKRSTLADANARRSPEPFGALAAALMQQLGRSVREHRDQMLLLLDSTTISLRQRGNEWAERNATRDQGLKVHVLMDDQLMAPVHQSITAVNVNDVQEGRKLPIVRGATYVFDKGYCDYAWWHHIAQSGAMFVTRAKGNAALDVVRNLPIAEEAASMILSDQLVRFRHKNNRGGHRNPYTGMLRLVHARRDDGNEVILLSNDRKRTAAEIAQVYRQRWQIELLFKWIKQHLQVKRFLGRSENAVRIQLLVALIAYLLTVLYGRIHRLGKSLWHVLIELREALMHREQPKQSDYQRRRRQEALMHSAQMPLPLRS